jgi:hypothetical protein
VVQLQYDCASDKALQIAARASLLVASGIHLANYVEGPLGGDGRAALDSALSELWSAAKVACGQASIAAGIAAATVDWQERLYRLRDDAAREVSGIAVIEELLASCARAGTADALERLIAGIVEPCAELYGDSWRDLVVEVGSWKNHPRREDDPYGISSIASVGEEQAQVRLQIHVETFGPAALAALAGAMAHECVCHVAARPLEPGGNESPFAEGFMDWAASYYLCIWAADLPGELGLIVEGHHARHGAILVRGSSAAAVARKGGRRAAQRLALRLQRHHGIEQAAACALVAGFAVRMNLAEVRRARKDGWATVLSTQAEGPLSARELECVEGERPPEDLL